MAFSLLTHTAKAGTSTGVTTDAIDTSGANLVVGTVADYLVEVTTIADNKSNTLTGRTAYNNASFSETRIYDTAAGTVGTGHTFTASSPDAASFPAIAFASFSGAAASPFDQQNGNGGTGLSTLQPGSVTPTEDNELIVVGICGTFTNTLSINSGFTILDQVAFSSGNNFAVAFAYLIQGAAAAVNPTWSNLGSTEAVSSIATYKAAAGVTAFPDHYYRMMRQA